MNSDSEDAVAAQGDNETKPDAQQAKVEESNAVSLRDLRAGPKFNELYARTWQIFETLFPTRQDQLSALDGLMSKHSVDRLRNGTAKMDLKRRLMWYIHIAPQTVMYGAVSGLIGSSSVDVDATLRDYGGTYRYFRYFAPEGRKDIEYVSGTIKIEKGVHGVPIMQHWSHDVPVVSTEPEHRGFVWVSGRNLFVMATRPRVLRLAISTVYDDPAADKEKSFMNGLVLSVRNSQKDPFSARFVMVHETNSALINELSEGMDAGPNSAGQQRFRDLLPKNETVWHMLT